MGKLEDGRTGWLEQRAHPRAPTKRKAYLVEGRKAWKCSLIDIAEGGARISLRDIELPAEGVCLVDAAARKVHLTRVVWRSDKEAGLQFLKSDVLTGPPGGTDGAISVVTRFLWKLSEGKL